MGEGARAHATAMAWRVRGTGDGVRRPRARAACTEGAPRARPRSARSVQSRAASAQRAQGARLGGCDEVCGESWPDVAECDAKYSASCGSVPNGCAKPSQAKPSQAKPSQAKPSMHSHIKSIWVFTNKNAFPYEIYLGAYGAYNWCRLGR